MFNIKQKIKDFTLECIRVFRITKKPSQQEFKTIVKVSAIGILIIGLIGALIQILWQLFRIK